jgi:protein O-GlcNAc transferase
MGLFDRLRSTGQAASDSDASKIRTSEHEDTRLIDEGHALEAAGLLDEAMQRYMDAIRLAPNPARAHLNRGNILLLKGDLKGALDAFGTAIKHKPDYAGAYYNIGNALLGNKQLDEAVVNYRLALELQPDYAEVHCALGVALKELGQIDGAVASLQKALEINPNLVAAQTNLGHILQDLYSRGNILAGNRQTELAVGQYRRALEINPDFAEAHCNLGLALKELGQLDHAVSSYRQALKIKPGLTEAHNNLGVALRDLGMLDNAISSFNRALKINPHYAEAHYNLAETLKDLGQFESALESYRRALEINPDFAEAHNNLGFALHNLGQLDGAVANYRRALTIRPDYAEAHGNLAVALTDLRQLDLAVTSYLRALEIKPDLAEAHCNLGNTLKDLGQFENATACYRRALKIKPDLIEAHCNLGNTLKDLGQFDGAESCYRDALNIKSDYAEALSGLLFALTYTANHASSYHLELARQYGQAVAKMVVTRFSARQCAARPERLRIGLVSGDLRNHPVGHFLEGLLANIDPARLELIAYPTQHKEDEFTARIRPYFSAWKPLFCKSEEAAARLIHADGVHVLLDLSGHTGYNRLSVFAWKPAPVQVSWLGYWATTGVAEIDYLLADEVGVPKTLQEQFTETVWYLPDTRLCFSAPAVDLPVTPLPALSNGMITFGCFQNLSKAGDGVLAAWGKIFSALPNASLRMQCKQLGDPDQIKQLALRLQRYGIAPARVTMHGPVQRKEYLSAYTEVDLILDTFPFPGGTTTCEALWMGVPTLTLAGDTFVARQGASLLTAAGLEEWVATSKEEYIAKAIALANDKPKLTVLRAGLRQQVLDSPLFDAPRFARNFEDALWGMWEGYQAKQG